MLEILLMRHGQTDWNVNRRIMGRNPVPLNRLGRSEAKKLARLLTPLELQGLFTSPALRAVQTAEFLAKDRDLELEFTPEVTEIDYGHWVGKHFDEVIEEEAFRIYHKTPSLACAPGGEKMTEMFERAVGFIEKLRGRFEKGRVAVVSHADVIKAILVHYLGMDLNHMLRLRIDNTSMSLITFQGDLSRVMAINSLLTPAKIFESAHPAFPKK